jgi:hypothetical protein
MPILAPSTAPCASPSKIHAFIRPSPIANLRHVFIGCGDVPPVVHEILAQRLFGIGGKISELRHAIDDIFHQVKTIHIVEHNHIKRGSSWCLLPCSLGRGDSYGSCVGR